MENISYTKTKNGIIILSSGDWIVKNISEIENILSEIPENNLIHWDVSNISSFDSSGILIFLKYFKRFKSVKVEGYTEEQKEMFEILNTDKKEFSHKKEDGVFVSTGKYVYDLYTDLKDFSIFLGYLSASFFYSLLHIRNIRFKEITYHIHKSGFNAVFIIGLTSFLVGMVLSYQGSVQLAKFGADIFIVDTVAISLVRELGPMITAIVIAGRSGSSYTAEIGAMKITEEISAMRTMGFDPYGFLVLPRVIALMIVLPLLIFLADIMGIFGGMVAAQMELGISFTQFIERLSEVLELKQFTLGMIKGPVFAFIIASIGCFRGFQVSDNTESLGKQTTASVVNGIFLVIVFDAIFSIIYTGFGI